MTGLGVEQLLGLVALGIGVGAYGTLIGAGGGFVLMSVLLLLYPDKNADLLSSCKPSHFSRYCVSRHLVDAHGMQYEYSFNYLLGLAISVVVGYVSSFLGKGSWIIRGLAIALGVVGLRILTMAW